MTKKQVILEIENELENLRDNPIEESFSRFCWLANEVNAWERFNNDKII